ncbi:MAG: hypothetical protein AAGD47_07100 [Pseudomonadota bacterium]
MSKLFLGPVVHWIIVLILIALGWIGGIDRLHVTDFNLFLILVLAATVIALLVVLKTSPPGRRIKRDPIRNDAQTHRPDGESRQPAADQPGQT